jgi:GMP synthase (glutamine-hydrolysing)
MRFRLLQARQQSDPVLHEEREAFAFQLGVDVDTIAPYDLLTHRSHFEDVTADVDIVLVGGSGDFSVLDDEPWLPAFFDTLKDLAVHQFPTFCSCFGFQGMVVALGGQIVRNSPGGEVGTFSLQLTPQANDDLLFSGLPQTFLAQEGHKDCATELPSGMLNLASSQRCEFQAVHIGSGPVYATQFHPELTGPTNRQRFMRYFDLYSRVFGRDRAAEMADEFEDSPEASALLRRFVTLVATGGFAS